MIRERQSRHHNAWEIYERCRKDKSVKSLAKRQFAVKISRLFKMQSRDDAERVFCDFLLDHQEASERTRDYFEQVISGYLRGRRLLREPAVTIKILPNGFK